MKEELKSTKKPGEYMEHLDPDSILSIIATNPDWQSWFGVVRNGPEMSEDHSGKSERSV